MEDLSEEVGRYQYGPLSSGRGFKIHIYPCALCYPKDSSHGDMFQSLVLASIIALV
jgi:hypothetical protein